MSSPLYEINLLEFSFEGKYATVRIVKLDSGLCSEWWISHNLDGNLHVAGSFMIPVMGSTVEDAERRCALIAQEVVDFAVWAGNGESGVPGASDESRRAHCLAHLRNYAGSSTWEGGVVASRTASRKVDTTVELYRLALGFNINNPATLIAQAEGLGSVKTVHERLNYGRRLGLLDSPGKGSRRSKKDSVVLDSDYE